MKEEETTMEEAVLRRGRTTVHRALISFRIEDTSIRRKKENGSRKKKNDQRISFRKKKNPVQ